MNKETYNILHAIAYGKPFEVRPALQKYLSTVTISEKEEVKGTRTGTQNNALWLYFQKVADALIEKGVSMRKIFESTQQKTVFMICGYTFKRLCTRQTPPRN